MLRERITLAALAAVILTAATASSCDIQPQGSTPGKTCGTEIHEPIISPDHPDSIEAITHSQCDHPPLSHRLSLYIEEQLPGDLWSEVESMDLNNFTACDEIPGPGHDTGCTRLVPCLDGTYKATYIVYGTGKNASGEIEDFTFRDTSAIVQIRCGA